MEPDLILITFYDKKTQWINYVEISIEFVSNI